MRVNLARAHVAILFALLFLTIGWMAPVTYASYASQDNFIEVHNFHAQNASVDAESHMICFNRTMHQSQSGKVFTELYLVSPESNNRIEVDAKTQERYFQEGHFAVETPFDLPPNLSPGDYKYVLVIQMGLANGRVNREFSFTSETFKINGGGIEALTPREFPC